MKRLTPMTWEHKGVLIFKSVHLRPAYGGKYYITVQRRDILSFVEDVSAAFRVLRDAQSFIDDWNDGRVMSHFDPRVVTWSKT